MAIAFDAATNSHTAVATSITVSHTCTGSELILFVGINIRDTSDWCTGVTYNGVAMTQVGTQTTTGNRNYLYCLAGPASGTHNIVASFSSSVQIGLRSISYTGAKQVSTVDNSATATGTGITSLSPTLTPVAANCWLVATFRNDVGAATMTTGIFRADDGSTADIMGDSNTTVSGSSSLVYDWSGAGAGDGVAVMASFAPPDPPIVPGVGAATITGKSISFQLAVGIAAAVLALTGYASGILNNRTINVPAGVITYSGQAPTIRTGVERQPAAGAITYTGKTPSVRLIINIPAGSLTYTPRTPSIRNASALGLVVLINGQDGSSGFRQGSLTIHNVLGQSPGSATFKSDTLFADAGGAIKLGLADFSDDRILFTGEIQKAEQLYEDITTNPVWMLQCVDDSFRLNRRAVWKQYSDVAAETIAADIISSFTTGFTANNIQVGLPTVSIIFAGDSPEVALSRLATNIGAYFYFLNKNLHFFITETVTEPENLTDSAVYLLNKPPLTLAYDLSQIRTRELVSGVSVALAASIDASETIFPVVAIDNFETDGGTVVLGAQNGISYTGIDAGGGGSLIGTGASPSAAPNGTVISGFGITDGVHNWGVTFVTVAGESIASPIVTITTGGSISAPASAPIAVGQTTGGLMPSGQSYDWEYTYVSAVGETTPSPPLLSQGVTAGFSAFQLSGITVGPAGTIARKLYRRDNNDPSGYSKIITINDNTTTTYTDIAHGPGSPAAPSSNTTSGGQVSFTSIQIGSASVTARKLYRTIAGGSQLKLLATIADNTTTIYTDSIADGSLGANVPTSDASGLTQGNGQILAGATTILVAGAGGFNSSGGWAKIGSQNIRYTGISGNSLTGVPATGNGALTATVAYNTTITALPALTGISGSLYSALQGDQVAIFVQVDDTDAQTALGLLELDDSGNVTDGIHENIINDTTLTSAAQCLARGQADLYLFKSAKVTIVYDTLDRQSRVGRTVTVNLTTLGITGDFTLQEVSISEIDSYKGGSNGYTIPPRFHVVASNTRFSLEDLLRHVFISV